MQTLAQVPRDHSWSLLMALDHVHEDDVSEAAEAWRMMRQAPSFDPIDYLAHPYSNTENGDLAALLDGEAEEWNSLVWAAF